MVVVCDLFKQADPFLYVLSFDVHLAFYAKSYSLLLPNIPYNNPVTCVPCFVNAGSGVVFQRVHSVPCWLPA